MWVLTILVACSGGDDGDGDGDGDPCLTADTADPDCLGGGTNAGNNGGTNAGNNGGTNAGNNGDNGTAAQTSYGGTFVADIVFSDGSTNILVGTVTSGGYADGNWGFGVIGTPPTHSVVFSFATGASGPGTWTITNGDGDSPAAYTDTSVGLANSGFASTGGSFTIDSWTPATELGQDGAALTGSFSMSVTNVTDPKDPPPVPLTATVEGAFVDMFLFDANL